MDKITVTNDKGQVSSFGVTGPMDPRAQVLRQRIANGELTEGDRSGDKAAVVVNEFALVRDEKGDLLRSIHGGGLDPDALGDARGVPSGSGISAAEVAKSAQVAVDALEQIEKNADANGSDVSAATKSVKVTAEAQVSGAKSSK